MQAASGTLTCTVRASDLPGPLVNTVIVTGTLAVGPALNALATATVNLTSTEAMTVSKTVNLTVAGIGQIISYTYRVTNTGNISLTGIAGSDDKLGAVAFSPTTLEPMQAASGTLTYTVRASDLPGPLVNTVTVTSTPAIGPAVNAKATASVNLTSTWAITVVKTADVTVAQVGQTITYTYQVTNTGDVTLTGIAGSDDKLGSFAFSPNTLEPLQSTSAILTYTVRQGDLPGPLVNKVTVTGTTLLGQQHSAQAMATVTVIRRNGLDLYLPVIARRLP
jgi:uncharacterized repeat protein (TIGR01451 family)